MPRLTWFFHPDAHLPFRRLLALCLTPFSPLFGLHSSPPFPPSTAPTPPMGWCAPVVRQAVRREASVLWRLLTCHGVLLLVVSIVIGAMYGRAAWIRGFILWPIFNYRGWYSSLQFSISTQPCRSVPASDDYGTSLPRSSHRPYQRERVAQPPVGAE